MHTCPGIHVACPKANSLPSATTAPAPVHLFHSFYVWSVSICYTCAMLAPNAITQPHHQLLKLTAAWAIAMNTVAALPQISVKHPSISTTSPNHIKHGTILRTSAGLWVSKSPNPVSTLPNGHTAVLHHLILKCCFSKLHDLQHHRLA